MKTPTGRIVTWCMSWVDKGRSTCSISAGTTLMFLGNMEFPWCEQLKDGRHLAPENRYVQIWQPLPSGAAFALNLFVVERTVLYPGTLGYEPFVVGVGVDSSSFEIELANKSQLLEQPQEEVQDVIRARGY